MIELRRRFTCQRSLLGRDRVPCWMTTAAVLLIGLGPAERLVGDEAKPAPPAASEPLQKSAESPAAQPAPPSQAPNEPEQSVEQLAELARKSVVVITFNGRDGKQQGLGTGFVIHSDGLIATNLHVIGQARPIAVQFDNGKTYDVQSIHASDRALDLALVKIDAHDLPVLPLGDSDQLKDGQSVVALGHPHGLKYSVVSGVLSGRREIQGRPMLQLAIPIEPGNSGGPLLDRFGRVHGILTLKLQTADSIGFAVASNSLKPLLENPNSIPMSRWLTIGALDPAEWTVPMGGRWRQRSGRILASEPGEGFGGRSLCLSQRELPKLPYEVAASVRLDDESGAAGLVFAADGGDKHYGFYPSGGKLRLTRFDGPSVYSWQVLSDQSSEHYRAGEWNRLKVRVEKDRLICFVNDEQHLQLKVDALGGGQVGLAKFRDTTAEFKGFRLAKEIPSERLPPDVAARLTKRVAELPLAGRFDEALIEELLPEARASASVMKDYARKLEQRAARLKRLAQLLHQRQVQAELVKALKQPEDQIELFRAGLLIAWLDNEDLDVDESLKQLDRLARELKATVSDDASPAARIELLNEYLFRQQGFHGSRLDYDSPSNSYLNEVLDDREGLPITLSVLYLELAARLGLTMHGIGLPGHFVVQHRPADGEPQLIDVYEEGKLLSREDASKIVRGYVGRDLQETDLAPASKRDVVLRMLYNLRGIAMDRKDSASLLTYVDTLLALAPESVGDRSLRAMIRLQEGDREGALADADWLLENQPEGVDLDRVRAFRQSVER